MSNNAPKRNVGGALARAVKNAGLFFATSSSSKGGRAKRGKRLLMVRLACICVVALGLTAVILSLMPRPAKAAACVWTGTVSTAWATNGNWSSCSGAGSLGPPAATDTVTIPNVTNDPVISTAGITVASITIQSGGLLTINSGTGRTVVVTGAFTIDTGGTFTTANAGAVTHNLNVGGNFSNSGTFTAANTSITAVSLNGSAAQNIQGSSTTAFENLTIANTSATVTATVNFNVNGTMTVNTNAVFSPDAAVVIGGTTNVITGTGTVQVTRTAATPDYNSQYGFSTDTLTNLTVDYAGAGAQTVSVLTYGGLTLSGSGDKTLTGVTTIGLDLTLAGTATATTASAMTIGDDLTIGSGTTLTVTNGFSVGGTSSITGSLVYSGTTGTKSFANTITINAGGVWDNSANEGITINGDLIHNGTTFTAGTGIYLFDSDLTIGGTSPLTIPNVTVNSGGDNVTNTGNLTITAALAGAGTLTNGATGVLTIDFAGAIGVATLTATAAGNVVNYSFAGAQTVKAATYDTLNLKTSGTKTLAAATTVNTTLTIDSGVTLDVAAITLTIATGTINVNGTLDFSSSTGSATSTGTSVLAMGSTGLIQTVDDLGLGPVASASLIGTWTTTTIDTNGTVEYDRNATSGQVVTDRNYNNLTITGATQTKTWTIAAARTVNGNVTINTGAPLTISGAQTINVKGNWSNGGTFTPGTSTIAFNGTSAQTIGGANATTFNNLTIANSAGVSLSGVNATVNLVLALNVGDLTTGANTLNMAVGATSTGAPAPGTDVVGNVTRTHTFTTGTSYAFGNSFITLNFTAAGTKPTAVNINLVKAAPSAPNEGFSTAVERTYSITPTGGAGFSSTLRLHYLDAELNGNVETAGDFDLWRHDGVDNWQRQVKTGADTTNNWVEKSGVTAFSLWTIAGGGTSPGPTAVKLKKFNAASFADGVQLSWESGFEANNLGYQLYREQNGVRSRVTPSVVAGSALSVGQGNKLTAGNSYTWFDAQGTADTVYYLESIDLNGARSTMGPIYPYSGASSGKRSPLRERARLLGELNGASASSSSSAASGAAAQTSWPTTLKEEGRSAVLKLKPKSIDIQQAIAAGQAVKIAVRRSGWYRVSQPELAAAGWDSTSDARLLQLYADGVEVPIRMSNEGSRLKADDTIEFYGVGLDTPTTDTRVYWLINGTRAGQRITPKKSKSKGGDQNFTEGGGLRSFEYTTERREKLIYSSHLLNGDAENIFGPLIFSDPVEQLLRVNNYDAQGSAVQPQLEVALQGLTAQAHEVQVQLNGSDIGTITFSGTEHPVGKFTLSRALLHEGDNSVTLASRNGDSDVSFIDYVRLSYAHQYRADNNALGFSAPGGQVVRVDGFSNANIRVVDITNPSSPLEIATVAGPSGSGYGVRLQTNAGGTRTLLAFADELAQTAASVTANQPSSWNASTNGADMVIITHRDFRQAVEPLATLRRNQGLSVAVVDVEDVYDEFSYGAHTPVALKAFLARATSSWSRRPGYLLLVGDSSWDPRNYLDQGANDFVPTKLIDTAYLETSSDDWLADFGGTGLPDMAIGRLPGRTAAEIQLMVSKILSYEQEREMNAPLRGAVLVADTGFETQSSGTGSLLPAGVTVQSINRGEVGNDDVMRGQIVDALNQGPMIVNYYGHGSVGVWTGAGVLDTDLAGNLTNSNRLSLYVMMTCLNGYANDAYIDSLSESAMKAPNGGAVAVWASSGFTTPGPQEALDREFYRLLFGGQPVRLGEATRSAKAATSDLDVRRTWTLLGDPAMRIR